MALRIGIGYDVHAFTSQPDRRPLRLGGITIPEGRGLEGHSDADVLCHAIADALLGAARLGDIGEHFPDDDPQYEDADSIELLAQVATLVEKTGFQIIDIDSVIVAEQPRLAGYRQAMRQSLAKALGLDPSAVGVKATTTEGLGAIGRAEGIAATAVALLSSTGGD